MVITNYREYFKLITAYHRTPLDKRPSFLAGFILLNTRTHPDPITKQKLSQFYAKEVLRHGQSADNRKPSN